MQEKKNRNCILISFLGLSAEVLFPDYKCYNCLSIMLDLQ